MSNGDEECDIRPGTVTPKKLPKQGGGGGHEFVTELPEVGEEGIEYVLMDDISDCSTYKGTYAWSPECEAYVCTSGSGGGAVERYTFEQTATGWRAKRNNTVIFTYVDRDTIDSYENTATGFKIIRGGSVIFEHTDGGGGDCPEYTAESTPTGWQLLKDGVVIFTYVDKNDEYIIESTVDGWVFKENGVVKFTYTEPADDPSDGTYFTSGTLTTVIAGTSTVAASSVTGLTLADVVIGETLIYDEFGTVGRVTAVSGTNLTVETITTAPGERRGTRLGAVNDYTDLPATCAAATALGWQTPLAGDFAYVREDTSHDDHLTEWVISAIDGSCNITWAYSHTLNAGNYVLDIYKYGDYPSGNPIPKNADGSVTLPKDEDTKYDFESTADGWRVKDHDTGTVLYTYVDVDTDTKYDFEDVTSSGVVVGWRVKDHDTGTVLYTHTDVGDTTYDFEAVTVGGNIVGWRVKDGDTGTVLFTYTDLNDESDGTYFTSDTLDTDITDQTTVAASTVTGLTLSDVVIGETLIYDGAGTVGVVTAVSGTDLIVDTITTSGSGDASSYVYKTTGTFDGTIDNTTNVNLSTLTDASGNTPTASDIIIGKTLAWDDDGTVALAVAISGSSVTFKTMTLSGSGGGGSYYVDPRGDELLSIYASLDSNQSLATNNTNVAMKKRSGTIEQPSVGLFRIPAGVRVEMKFTHASSSSQGDVIFGWYNTTDSVWITDRDGTDGLKEYCPYSQTPSANGYQMGGTYVVQWTNETGHTVDIALRVRSVSSAMNLREDYSGVSITEIGRVVDPVKYLDNSEGLQDTPVGNIISYMGNNVPKHYLACDGTVYNIGDYPALEAHFITEFGRVNYFGGNGTTTWAVPDLQGEFLRGTGTNSHADQGSGANVGIHQDATKHFNVQEEVTDTLTSINVTGTTTNYDSATSVTSYRNKYARTGYDPASTVFNSYITSRPTNTSVKYCIKYESTMQMLIGTEQFKVGGTFTFPTANSTWQRSTFTVTHGDSTLLDSTRKIFYAPVTGYYAVSANCGWTLPTTQALWMGWHKRATDLGTNSSANINTTVLLDNTAQPTVASGSTAQMHRENLSGVVYLEKGDPLTLQFYVMDYNITASAPKFEIALITTGVTINDGLNIIASDDIYTLDEQMIGAFLGKPLYKKTFKITDTFTQGDHNYTAGLTNIEEVVEMRGEIDSRSKCFTSIVEAHTSAQMVNTYYQASDDKIHIHINVSGGYGSGTAFVTMYYTKTTDVANSAPTKNMLLINRPDLWTVGTEYDFGGGLYGMRKKLTLPSNSHTPGTDMTTAQFLPKNGNSYRIFDWGGYLEKPGAWRLALPYNHQYAGNSTCMYANTYGTGEILLQYNYGLANASSDSTADIWCIYTKS